MEEFFDFSRLSSMDRDYKGRTTAPTYENCIDKMPLAMAYIPMQQFNSVYELEAGLSAGTIFPELNKPFLACRPMGADMK